MLHLLVHHMRTFNKVKGNVNTVLPSINVTDSPSSSNENQLITILEIIYRTFKALLNLTVGRYYYHS